MHRDFRGMPVTPRRNQELCELLSRQVETSVQCVYASSASCEDSSEYYPVYSLVFTRGILMTDIRPRRFSLLPSLTTDNELAKIVIANCKHNLAISPGIYRFFGNIFFRNIEVQLANQNASQEFPFIVSDAELLSCFSGNGYIVNRLSNRPITSTEEEVRLWFQTRLPNSSLFHVAFCYTEGLSSTKKEQNTPYQPSDIRVQTERVHGECENYHFAWKKSSILSVNSSSCLCDTFSSILPTNLAQSEPSIFAKFIHRLASLTGRNLRTKNPNLLTLPTYLCTPECASRGRCSIQLLSGRQVTDKCISKEDELSCYQSLKDSDYHFTIREDVKSQLSHRLQILHIFLRWLPDVLSEKGGYCDRAGPPYIRSVQDNLNLYWSKLWHIAWHKLQTSREMAGPVSIRLFLDGYLAADRVLGSSDSNAPLLRTQTIVLGGPNALPVGSQILPVELGEQTPFVGNMLEVQLSQLPATLTELLQSPNRITETQPAQEISDDDCPSSFNPANQSAPTRSLPNL
ncbi:hypothetical protein CLF_100084 [Clonorchis sinensis]|uniref:Uncharacterized protein n=1 Tax=Clonorchis sinensis TaxID=79923 RepID=G7Y2L2_CLOSI|nr:hypothetical protein CLF_100084 [Clonorchis sinensis]